MKEKVQAVIDEIRPQLQGDGGDIELVEVTADGTVRVRLQGACSACPGAAMTLKAVVESLLKRRVPEVKSVERVG
jgi:Fe-S cluster biogenesis protein NfuA